MQSVWKGRRKPFLFADMILTLIAVVFFVISLICWNSDSVLYINLIILVVGLIFILRGIESLLNEKKDFWLFGIGLFALIVSIIKLLHTVS